MGVQAGASDAGWQIAAETAEVVFNSARSLDEAQSYSRDVKGRVAALGRSPAHLVALPGAFVEGVRSSLDGGRTLAARPAQAPR